MDLNPAQAARVDAVFSDMDRPQHPGAALLVTERDKIIYRKCYGLADVETQRPVTTDTSFYLGSIAKPFTAMAIMLLAQDGRLDYEDRLSAFFPQLPSWAADMSLRHLLHHTSGLPGYTEFFSTNDGIREWTRDINDLTDGLTNQAVFAKAMGLAAPLFPAGTQYAYSGMGYVLLAMVAEVVSGRSIGDFLKARILNPLGMKHTVAYDASRPARHKLAHGYWKENDQFVRWDYPMLTVGDGGLFSTLDDLFLWDQALNTERLVPKAAMEQAFASGRTNDGASVGYGFGWHTDVRPFCNAAERKQLLALGGDDLRYVAHGGACVAYFNYILRLLDTQCTILVLTNHLSVTGPRIRAHHVAEIIFSR